MIRDKKETIYGRNRIIADILGSDPGYVSNVLRGKKKSIKGRAGLIIKANGMLEAAIDDIRQKFNPSKSLKK